MNNFKHVFLIRKIKMWNLNPINNCTFFRQIITNKLNEKRQISYIVFELRFMTDNMLLCGASFVMTAFMALWHSRPSSKWLWYLKNLSWKMSSLATHYPTLRSESTRTSSEFLISPPKHLEQDLPDSFSVPDHRQDQMVKRRPDCTRGASL